MLVLLIGSAAAGSLMVYAKPVRAILVDYSSMNEIGNRIYLEAGLQMEDTLASNLLTQAEAAEDQVAEVFGSRVSAPYLIFAITPKTWNRYAENPTGQTYYYPWRNYIVIGPEGLNENVISHEFSHAELRERLHNKKKVPAWFDEGLATMIDGRYLHSEAVWKEQTNDGRQPFNMDTLDSYRDFDYGTPEAYLHYNLACHEVTRWYSLVGSEGLTRLIDELNNGKKFGPLYREIEGIRAGSGAQPRSFPASKAPAK